MKAANPVIKILGNIRERLPTPDENEKNDEDIESQQPPKENNHMNRFTYSPKTFKERVLVVFRMKNTLEKSRITRVPFRKAYKWVLLILLVLLAILLTPQLMPQWMGFEWATVKHLCQNSDVKLRNIEDKLRNLTHLQNSTHFLQVQKFDLRCMNESAMEFYHGSLGSPPRYLWPHECTSAIAKTSLTETQCHRQEANVCSAVGGIAGFFAGLGGNCVRQVGPDLCVEKTDVDRADALLELEKMRTMPAVDTNATVEVEPIAETANKRLQQVMGRLMTKIDFAADAFLLYSVLSIAVGVPLVIYRREKGSMVVNATFGLTKMWFVIVVVTILTVYDSAALILRETDFSRFFQNFMRDPCYVDPVFSARRVALITEACNEIGSISGQSDIVLQQMDSMYYDVRLFGHCKDETRELAVHPRLENIDQLRQAYRQGNISNPGSCNATELNDLTSVAPSNKKPKWKALLGSGVIAQLMLKFVLTSWLLHMFSYLEPMVLHNGKVEIWGPSDNQETLSQDEVTSVSRFARDKHLLSLCLFSVLLILEILLIIYSIMMTSAGMNQALPEQDVVAPADPNIMPKLECPTSLFPE